MAAVVFLLATAASGCGGARPSKYYELQMPAQPPAAATNPYPVVLLVGRLGAPDLLRGDRLVYRTGPEEMGAYEYQRWVERPTEMIEGMLIETLRDSGRFRSVGRAGSRSKADYILRGHLSRLEEVDDPSGIKASVALELELFHSDTSETVWYRSYSHDEPVSGKAMAAIVRALDKNVQMAIQQLTADVLQYFADHPVKETTKSGQ
jgi:ABC-type uncharacterized transport system auxiliary subunit